MFIRVVSQTSQALIIGIMAITLPLSPFVCALLGSDWRYATRYVQTLSRCARMIRQMVKANVVARRITLELSRRTTPDEHVVGACTHCGQCCIHQSCVFLEFDGEGTSRTSRCAVYNNWFWKRTSCGSYPISGQEIEVYDCPSFQAVPIKVVALPRSNKPSTVPADTEHVVIPWHTNPRRQTENKDADTSGATRTRQHKS
jgi:hypothetical protein